MFKPASAKDIERARALRREMTKFELKLWYQLRALRTDGFHFRRQAPFRGYYLDFVEHKLRLVIEADGGQHSEPEQMRHDRVRDRVLIRHGYLTLRFDNGEIATNLDGVMERIGEELRLRSQRPPPGALRAPTSPQRGR
jgi:very-short-patch-repair endonuclease